MGLTEWSETLPNDNGFAGDGDDEIVAAKAGIKERLELDHQFSGELDPLEGDCDGYHKKLTMKAQSSDPTPLTGAGVLYTKLVDDVVELFFKDETTGVVNQLTEQGVLSLNTLANNINLNDFGFTGKSISNIITIATLNTSQADYRKTYDLYYPAEILISETTGSKQETFSTSIAGNYQPRFLMPGRYRFYFKNDSENIASTFFRTNYLYVEYLTMQGIYYDIIKLLSAKSGSSFPAHFNTTFAIKPFLFTGDSLSGLLEEVE